MYNRKLYSYYSRFNPPRTSSLPLFPHPLVQPHTFHSSPPPAAVVAADVLVVVPAVAAAVVVAAEPGPAAAPVVMLPSATVIVLFAPLEKTLLPELAPSIQQGSSVGHGALLV